MLIRIISRSTHRESSGVHIFVAFVARSIIRANDVYQKVAVQNNITVTDHLNEIR